VARDLLLPEVVDVVAVVGVVAGPQLTDVGGRELLLHRGRQLVERDRRVARDLGGDLGLLRRFEDPVRERERELLLGGGRRIPVAPPVKLGSVICRAFAVFGTRPVSWPLRNWSDQTGAIQIWPLCSSSSVPLLPLG
jgi:hypothetical protein